ncbi:MAG TPA: hypothetical protein VLL25_12255 [Acidimicrobiales bacterium]|nr:hypothetical protein [Acidimicrobiales bacterium]
MFRFLRPGLVAILLAPSVAIVLISGPAGAQTACLPPPNLLLTQAARVAGTSSTMWADIQAVGQRDAALATATGGQAVQDLLAAINHDGYQWDCATSQLVATPGAPHPTSPAGATGQPAATVPGSNPAAARPPGGSSARTSASVDSTSASAPPSSGAPAASQAAAPASNTSSNNGVTSDIPTILIVGGLILSAAAVVLAVRRVSRH